jgi:toxin CcdB
MAQFDVHRNETGFNPHIPYLLDAQADLFADFTSRIVIPLRPRADVRHPLKHLNPIVEVEGAQIVVMTQDMFNVPTTILGKRVASLVPHRDQLIRAIDFLVLGF